MLTVKRNLQSKADVSPISESFPIAGLFSQELFVRLLGLEHNRAERSGRQFVLVLFQITAPRRKHILQKLAGVLASSTRKTDLKGWYDGHSTIGVIFTELGSTAGEANLTGLLAKLTNAIHTSLSPEESGQVKLSYGLYPEKSRVYPPLALAEERAMRTAKA
jgi:hypothetical protein